MALVLVCISLPVHSGRACHQPPSAHGLTGGAKEKGAVLSPAPVT